MKLPTIDYIRPERLKDAVTLLDESPDAWILAGGQSLVCSMALGHIRPSALVDLADVGDLKGIREDLSGSTQVLDIGAGEVMRNAENNSRVQTQLPLLVKILRTVGAPSIRTRATLGGCLGWADPTSQLFAALVAMNAEVVVASRSSMTSRSVLGRVQDGLPVAEKGEVIVRIRIPMGQIGVHELVRRTSITWPTCGVVAVRHLQDQHFPFTTVAMHGAASRQLAQSDSASGTLSGSVQRAGARLLASSHPVSDARASADYRRRVLPNLIGIAAERLEDVVKSE